LKILIVDDHSLVREGLKAILNLSELTPNFVEAWDADTVQAQLEQHPDIALMLLDIQMPGCTGLELLSRIVNQRPLLPIIMLSAEHDTQTVTDALNNGASGFLPKNSLNQVLVSAIRLVLAGGIYIPPEALHKAASIPAAASQAEKKPPTLESLGFTARQIDVFRLLVQGQSNKQICRQIDIAEATVKIHVRAILRSLTVSSRSEAIAKAAQIGLEVPQNNGVSTSPDKR
jgi:DNA-binding NarL/FixJ family response regulator